MVFNSCSQSTKNYDHTSTILPRYSRDNNVTSGDVGVISNLSRHFFRSSRTDMIDHTFISQKFSSGYIIVSRNMLSPQKQKFQLRNQYLADKIVCRLFVKSEFDVIIVNNEIRVGISFCYIWRHTGNPPPRLFRFFACKCYSDRGFFQSFTAGNIRKIEYNAQ